jgi:hypothetical protein
MVPQMYHIGKDEHIQESNHIYIKYFRPQIFESKLKPYNEYQGYKYDYSYNI